MALEVDHSLDAGVWADPEPVDLESVTRIGGRKVGVGLAKRRAITIKEIWASSGRYVGADVNWWIPSAELPADFSPKIADVIHDRAGQEWTVLDVQRGKKGYSWRLTCRDLILVHKLHDRITIETPEYGIDKAGVRTTHWKAIVTDLPARVQPDGRDIVDRAGIRGVRERFRVALARELDLTMNERIPWKGSYLDLADYQSSETLHSLPEILAELRP